LNRIPIARKGDTFVGYCSPCDATVTGVLLGDTGSAFIDNRKGATLGGFGIGRCGHRTIIVGGSSLTYLESRKAAYKGAPVANCIAGKIISGSGTTRIGV
jgi:uncharacterized Zn-binding protein involved in type VI secretion